MPAGNNLAVTNQYGAVELADRNGKTDLSISYGSLKAGRLNALDNTVSLAYSNGELAYLNTGNVSVRYGGFSLTEAEQLVLTLSYTSGSKIGLVNREADINLKYSGGFELGLGKAIRKATVSAEYSGVKINASPNAAFNLNVAVSYGGFDYHGQYVHITSKSEGYTSQSYTGYWNKAGNNVVDISSRYGNVSLN